MDLIRHAILISIFSSLVTVPLSVHDNISSEIGEVQVFAPVEDFVMNSNSSVMPISGPTSNVVVVLYHSIFEYKIAQKIARELIRAKTFVVSVHVSEEWLEGGVKRLNISESRTHDVLSLVKQLESHFDIETEQLPKVIEVGRDAEVELAGLQVEHIDWNLNQNFQQSDEKIQNVVRNIQRTDLNSSRMPASVEKNLGPVTDKMPVVFDEPSTKKADYFVVIYSGDGGWSEFTQQLSSEFSKRGVPVVGVNSLFYFWKEKEPHTGGQDLSELIRAYQKSSGMKKFKLVGYSFGADAVSFFVNRLEKDVRDGLLEVSILAPGEHAKFEFELKDWFGDEDEGLPIVREIEKIHQDFRAVKFKCLYADNDRKSVCENPEAKVASYRLKGGHHFNNDYRQFDGILW